MPKKNKQALIIVVVVIVAVCGAAFLALLTTTSSTSPQGGTSASDASSTVVAFGAQLQNVSLLAPDASSTIASAYGPYVDPALLSEWEANPSSAPGRQVSSPWPDHIQVDSVAPQGAGYVVNGEIVLMTSNEVEHGGNAGRIPVVIQLVPENGELLIAAYQQQAQ